MLLCYVNADVAFQRLCANITRAVNSDVTRIVDRYENISSTTQGEVVLNVDYEPDLPFGTFRSGGEATYQTEGATTLFRGQEQNPFVGEIGSPELTFRSQFQFERKNWLLTWTVFYVGESSDLEPFLERYDTNPTSAGDTYVFNGFQQVLFKVDTEATAYHNLTARYRSDQWTVVGGIANIFSEEPPFISTAPYGFSALTSRLGATPKTSQYSLHCRELFFESVGRF